MSDVYMAPLMSRYFQIKTAIALVLLLLIVYYAGVSVGEYSARAHWAKERAQDALKKINDHFGVRNGDQDKTES